MTYKQSLVQVDEVLKYLTAEDLEKIPISIRNTISKEKDPNYSWKYDEEKDITEQNIDRKTVALLSFLNLKYMLSEEERVFLEKKHAINQKRFEEKDRLNYEKIFEKSYFSEEQKSDNEEKALIKCNEDKWYKKVFNCFRKIFQK